MKTWRKQIVSWRCGETLYVSVPFTWMLDDAAALASSHKGRVIAGGPAVALCGAPWADETPAVCKDYDVLSMHNPCATFTTRGCPNSCAFCAVPQIEGGFRELKQWKPAPMICDNNLLAASRKHFCRVIESLRCFLSCDFNQGLDARLFTQWHAEQISLLQNPMVRFSLDHSYDVSIVADAINLSRQAGLRQFGVYVLIGFDDTPSDALFRLDAVRSWGIRPNPMRFQPLNATRKNDYVALGWTDYELCRMVAYYSRLRWLEHIPYADFRNDITPLFRDRG